MNENMDLKFSMSLLVINSFMKYAGEWDEGHFISTVCMLIEEYCLKHGLNAKDTMQMMADTAETVELECGVYTGGLEEAV